MSVDIESKLAHFFSNYPETTYRKREVIHVAGKIPTHVFYIKKGYVKSFLSSSNGKELTIRIYKPGEFFSFMTAQINEPTIHTYEAITPVICSRALTVDFTVFLTKNRDLEIVLEDSYLSRLNAALRRLESIIIGNAKKRVLVTLAFLGRQVGIKENNMLMLPSGFTHQQLAGLTGLTRETVTLELDRIFKEGYILQNSKSIAILNIDYLKNLAYS